MNGTCQITIKSAGHAVGTGSFTFTITADKALSDPATITVPIQSKLIDDDFISLDFSDGTSSEIIWNGSHLERAPWNDASREIDPITEMDLPIANLMGYWRLNGTSGQTLGDGIQINDSSGRNNHGTTNVSASALTWADGMVSTGVDFDPVIGSNISMGQPADLNITGALTLMAWVYTDTSNQDVILGRSGVAAGFFGPRLATTIGGYYKYLFQITSDCNSGGNWVQTHNGFLVDGYWNHLVGTFIPGESVNFYINGQLYGSKYTSIASSCLPAGHDWEIGTDFFDGIVDEASIWNTALTQKDIELVYQRQIGNFGAGKPSSFISRVFNAGRSDASWNEISWVPSGPYGKSLPAGDDVKLPNYNTNNTESFSENPADLSLMSGLQVYYRFEGIGNMPDGAVIKDNSGNNRDAIAKNANGTFDAFETGVFGSAAKREPESKIEMPVDSALYPGSFTIAFWIKRLNDWDCLAATDIYGNTASTYSGIGIWLQIDDSGCNLDQALIVAVDGNNYKEYNASPNAFYPLDTWTHIAITFDTTTNEISVYRNGVEFRANSTTGSPDTVTDPGGTPYLWDGGAINRQVVLDEFVLWSRALNLSEIQSLYYRGKLTAKFQVGYAPMPIVQQPILLVQMELQ